MNAQVLVPLGAAIAGGLLGLMGTMLGIRHQRAVEHGRARAWARDKEYEAVAAVLAATNSFSRSEDDFDERWVILADAIDRAQMVVGSQAGVDALTSLHEAALGVLRALQRREVEPQGGERFWTCFDPVWPAMTEVKDATRVDLVPPDIPG